MELSESQLSQLKQIYLDAYKRFAKFCSDYKLYYWVCDGTALGAVRHSGFIPWDDDLDLMMLSDDYIKLQALRNEISKYNLELYFPGDKGYWQPYAKIGIPNTTFFADSVYELSIGISIDIFPMCEIGDDIKVITKDILRYKRYWDYYTRSFAHYPLGELWREGDYKKFCKCLLKMILFRPFRGVLLSKWKNVCSRAMSQKGSRIVCYSCYWSLDREIYLKEWFKEVTMVKFEDLEVPLPVGFDPYLTTLYHDYMTPPPLEKRISTHSCLYIDFEKRLSLKEVKKIINIQK